MKKLFLVSFVGCCLLVCGCAAMDDYVAKHVQFEHYTIGNPIPVERNVQTSIDRPHLRAFFLNNSRYIVLLLGITHGCMRIDPGHYATIDFDRPGTRRFLAHAWINSFVKAGQSCYKAPEDFAGESEFRVTLDNKTRTFWDKEYGDIIIFTDGSFSLNISDPYPKRFLKGPNPWDNVFVGSFYCIEYNRR